MRTPDILPGCERQFSSLQTDTARGSVRFKDRLIYGLLVFATTILVGAAAQGFIPSYKEVIAVVALPLAGVLGIAAGADVFGKLRRS